MITVGLTVSTPDQNGVTWGHLNFKYQPFVWFVGTHLYQIQNSYSHWAFVGLKGSLFSFYVPLIMQWTATKKSTTIAATKATHINPSASKNVWLNMFAGIRSHPSETR